MYHIIFVSCMSASSFKCMFCLINLIPRSSKLRFNLSHASYFYEVDGLHFANTILPVLSFVKILNKNNNTQIMTYFL